MSMLRSHELVKGKPVKGSGSILANFDAKTRKAFAKCANKAMEHKMEREKDLALKKELKEIHHQQEHKKQEQQVSRRHHSLTYWLVKASFIEIWRHLFSKDYKHQM